MRILKQIKRFFAWKAGMDNILSLDKYNKRTKIEMKETCVLGIYRF